MSANSDKHSKNNPGTRQRLIFLLVAMGVSVSGILLGSFTVGYVAFLLFGALYVLFFAGALRRLALFLYLLLAVVILTSVLAYFELSSDEMVVRVSSWLLIGSLYKQKIVQLGLAAIAGLIGGLLAVGVPFLLTLFISAEWILALRETHDLDRGLALRLLLDLALGIGESYCIADEGEITVTKPKGPVGLFGAPVIVVAKPYNVVVTERGGKVVRIEGPGSWTLHKLETVKAIVDLRPQGKPFEWKALTKDNVPLTGNGFIAFRIESWEEAKKRGDRGDFETKDFKGIISGPYPVYRRTLYRAVYRVSAGKDWQSQIVGTAQGQVAGAIRKFRVDEIFVVDEEERVTMQETALQQIIEQARSGAITAGYNWGVQVNGVNVIAIQMPEEAQQEFINRWGAPWRGWRAVVDAIAEGRKIAALAAGKGLASITEAQGDRDAARFRADAKRWEIVHEAIAQLEAADHETATTLKRAQAKSDADRITARADAEKETLFYKYLTRALEQILGRETAIEMVKAMARQRIGLDQIQQTLGLLYEPSRTLLYGAQQRRLRGEKEEGTPEEID